MNENADVSRTKGVCHVIHIFFGASLKELSMCFIIQRHIFKNIFCSGSLRYASTLRKKVFSTTSMNIFFLSVSKCKDSFVFAKTGLKEEGSQCQSKTFPKTFFALEVLSL